MKREFSKLLGIGTVVAGLGFAGAASATPIVTIFNFVPTTALTANTGSVLTAATITAGAPDIVTNIISDNTGLVTLSTIVSLTDPTPVLLGNTFIKTWTTALGVFTENLTVTAASNTGSSHSITATGTITCTACGALTSAPVFYSASYTQNGGPGAQINASFNNSTTPPTTVPEPMTLALLGIGLAGVGFARRKQA